MPSSDPNRRLQDILENIALIEAAIAEKTFDDFVADVVLPAAVERFLQRITEAAIKLGDEMDGRYPEVRWRALRGFGNVLRHDYDKLLDQTVWEISTERLRGLRAACEAEIERLG